jgi:VanZ family protein
MNAWQERKNWKLSLALAVVTSVYWGAMFVATHLPASQLPGGVPDWMDKPEHLAGFGLLAVLLCSVGAAQGLGTALTCAITLTLLGLYGVADEWSQALVPDRKPDWRDWLANMSGALLGVAVFLGSRALAAAWRRRRSGRL